MSDEPKALTETKTRCTLVNEVGWGIISIVHTHLCSFIISREYTHSLKSLDSRKSTHYIN